MSSRGSSDSDYPRFAGDEAFPIPGGIAAGGGFH
jgi:hypothetical protein